MAGLNLRIGTNTATLCLGRKIAASLSDDGLLSSVAPVYALTCHAPLPSDNSKGVMPNARRGLPRCALHIKEGNFICDLCSLRKGSSTQTLGRLGIHSTQR